MGKPSLIKDKWDEKAAFENAKKSGRRVSLNYQT
jgi:hypothetical protein